MAELDYEVLTEYTESSCRFDILIRPLSQIENRNGIVFENKVKSIGERLQLDKYAELGYDVVSLALLPESFDNTGHYPIIEYKKIHSILNSLPLDIKNCYHFFINEYLIHLSNTLNIYDTLRNYINETINIKIFRDELNKCLENINLNINDTRTFTYFYFYNFSKHLKAKNSNLIFGTHDYGKEEELPPNTRWIFRKDLQGPPYMESLIYRPFDPEMKFHINKDFEEIYKVNPFIIAPRIELWLDLNYIQKCNDSDEIGEIMIGSWTKELVTFLKEHEHYKALFTRKGSRNFHYEKVSLKDLPFSNLANRLMKMLSLIGEFR